MSLPGRINDFQALSEVQSQPFDDEFDNIINILSGVSQDKSIRIRNNDNTFAVARFDQLGTNDIVEFYKSGSEVLAIANNGQIVSSVAGGTAPISVVSNTLCTNLNADLLDGLHSSAFPLLSNARTAFSFTWFYDTPPAATEATNPSAGCFVVPAGAQFSINRLRIHYTGGSHTSGGVLTFTLKRRNFAGGIQADIGTVTLDNTNNTGFIIYNTTLGVELNITDGDIIYPLLTTRSGTISELAVNISISGKQLFTT